MKLNYKLTEDDYVALNVFHYKNSGSLKKQMMILRLLFPLLLLLICWVAKFNWDSYVLSGLLSLVFILILPKTINRSIVRSAKKLLKEGGKSDFCGDYILEFTDEGICGSTDAKTRTTEVKWSSVRKVVDDGTRIYIYINVLQAFIVPFGVFASDEERRDFERFIDEKIKVGSMEV